MIVVQIHSGLGNQLFMYAAARALAHRHGTGLLLDVDSDCRSGINRGSYVGHTFQLEQFNIRAQLPERPAAAAEDGTAPASRVGFYSAMKARLRRNPAAQRISRLLRNAGVDPARLLLRVSGQARRFYEEERGDWGYKPEFFKLPDDTMLRGCFFSYRYFAHIDDVIRAEFMLKEPLSAPSQAVADEITAGGETVSLHVRRGDTVTDPEYRSWYDGILTDAYYRNAVDYFRTRLHDPQFFVFSDDIDWVKSHLKLPGRLRFVDHNGPDKGYEDLVLMSRCKHNVTAGFSSFSWWGAYLNDNPSKIVVRTRRMNALDRLNHPDDFFPPEWVIVES